MKIAKNVNNLGTELVYDIFSKTKKLQSQGKKIIDLSLGQSAESPPEHVIEATIKALRDGNNGYTVPNGILECREAVSRKIQKLYNAKVSPDRIFIMNNLVLSLINEIIFSTSILKLFLSDKL